MQDTNKLKKTIGKRSCGKGKTCRNGDAYPLETIALTLGFISSSLEMASKLIWRNILLPKLKIDTISFEITYETTK
jgi:hypothetical protein